MARPKVEKHGGYTKAQWTNRLLATEKRIERANASTIPNLRAIKKMEATADIYRATLSKFDDVQRTETKLTNGVLTPFGYATEKDGRLLITNPAAHEPEWRTWCIQNMRCLVNGVCGKFEYIGPVVIESDEEIPEGYEEHQPA